MKRLDLAFQEFVESIELARDEVEFERAAARTAMRLGFRWFAYLRIVERTPKLISSYPKSWTSRYFDLHYQQLDPVVRRARLEHDLFGWKSGAPVQVGTKDQRRFFEEAVSFGILGVVTIPIRGGFGRMAAFTLASDDRVLHPEHLMAASKPILRLVGLHFHTHLAARQLIAKEAEVNPVLGQRERQCLAWAARGKTVAESALLLGISPRTVAFHLDNAKRKLDATSIAQAVAEAIRRRLMT